VTPVQSTIVQLTGTASRAALRASLRDRLRRTLHPAATRKAAPPHFVVPEHKTSEYLRVMGERMVMLIEALSGYR
jgi:hypothetical protein